MDKEMLIAEEDRFRLLAESAQDGMVFSENHVIIDANDRFADMFGLSSRKEAIGKKLKEFIPLESRTLLNKKTAEPSLELYEILCTKQDGFPFIVTSQGRDFLYRGRTIHISVLRDITRQKEENEKLKQHVERYRQLFENNLAAVFRTAIGGGLVEVNQALADIFGYGSLHELKKVSAHDLYYSEQDREKYMMELRKKGYLKNHQMRMKKKNGNEIWILENVMLVKDAKTDQEFIEGTLIDITETKRIQQELQERETNYKSLIEHTPDGILIHDEKGETVYANPAALNMIGISSLEDVENKNLFDYVLPEYHGKIRIRKKELNKEKDIPFMKIKIRRPDEKIVNVDVKTSRIMYHGKPAVEAVLHDTSLQLQLEREQMRLQLEKDTNRELKLEIASHIRTRQRLNSNQKYTRLILDSSIDLICACDREWRITEINHVGQKIFGYSPEEVLNKEVSVLYAEAEQYHAVRKSIENGESFLGEVLHIKKNKELLPVYISASVLKNEAGEIIGMMSISKDITQMKEAERQLKKSVHEKEILLKEIHHRVKNNLQVISSILKLQTGYVKDKKTIELLNECINRIASMAFIHSTLYMTKDFASINFSEYVGHIASNLHQSYLGSDKKIVLKMDVPEMFLHIDEAIPCGLIINELLSNSLKYGFLKKKKGMTGVAVKLKKENIILAIWDNGAGFPKTVNYRNAESLGLQLVMALAKQLGGKIKMESNPGKGTKFILVFRKTK